MPLNVWAYLIGLIDLIDVSGFAEMSTDDL